MRRDLGNVVVLRGRARVIVMLGVVDVVGVVVVSRFRRAAENMPRRSLLGGSGRKGRIFVAHSELMAKMKMKVKGKM